MKLVYHEQHSMANAKLLQILKECSKRKRYRGSHHGGTTMKLVILHVATLGFMSGSYNPVQLNTLGMPDDRVVYLLRVATQI